MSGRVTGRRPRRATRRGVTLLEVLATIVLMGIVLPVAMRGISLSLNAASLAKRSAEAAALAESKLNEIVAMQLWLSGSMSGDFEPDWPDYQWTAETLEVDMGLTEVTVRVTWMMREMERSVELSTFVYMSTGVTEGTTESSNESGSGGDAN